MTGAAYRGHDGRAHVENVTGYSTIVRYLAAEARRRSAAIDLRLPSAPDGLDDRAGLTGLYAFGRLGRLNRYALSKRLNAARFGILLGRHSRFEVPDHIRLRGRRVPFTAPRDNPAEIGNFFTEILFADCYGLRRFRGLRRILDVGANVGMFTLAARQAHPQAVIHAYEPNRRLAPYLDANAATANAEVFYEAVGDVSGTVRLTEFDSWWGRTVTVRDAAGEIPVTEWTTVVKRLGEVDLVKLDCEGAEWELLAMEEPWAAVGAVAAEIHRIGQEHSSDDAINALERLGFRIRKAEFWSDVGLVVASR